MGVAQVVEPDDARQAAPSDDAFEELADRLGVEDPASGIAEHQSSGPHGNPSRSNWRRRRRSSSTVRRLSSTLRRLERVLTPNSTGRPPTFCSVRATENRGRATLRSFHLSPTISPRRMPVCAARRRAGWRRRVHVASRNAAGPGAGDAAGGRPTAASCAVGNVAVDEVPSPAWSSAARMTA